MLGIVHVDSGFRELVVTRGGDLAAIDLPVKREEEMLVSPLIDVMRIEKQIC
jgi:hypothetical protein